MTTETQPTYKSGSAWATANMRNKKQLAIVVNLCKDAEFIGILLFDFFLKLN